MNLYPRKHSVVALANELVPIETALRLIGVDVPDGLAYRRSTKLYCPFGDINHADGGLERAFRVYPEQNTAWCFACQQHFTPVWLVATAWGQDTRIVATELLDRVGHRPLSMAQQWAQATRREEPPDRTLLREALQTYCGRICPDWALRQFDPVVGATLTRCLALLDLVHTEAAARAWLARVKEVMGRVLCAAGDSLDIVG